jgi:3-oxoacyl-[acyl-carrier-protein] synthase II
MSNRRKIVVTGMGTINALGKNVNDYWNNLLAGVSGAGMVTRFDTTDIATKIACEIKDFNPEDYMDKKEARRTDLFVIYAIAAGNEALTNAGLMKDGNIIDSLDKNRVGTLIGTGIGGFHTIREQLQTMDKKGARRISPFFIPMMITDMASGLCSIRWGFRGPNFCITSACATGNHSITTAYHLIERGDADVMITGGTEAALVDVGMAGFSVSKAMSRRNDDPKTASRPFDIDRDGFVAGEGSGIVVLESEEHALKRGAKIYAEVLGAGMSADAYHITEPCVNGEGAILSMSNALRDAGIQKEDVTYINTHGTSTPKGDKAEIASVKNLFGEHSKNIKVNSTKSMIGHLLGAAGGVETIALIKQMESGKLHPTINIFNQDPECDMDVVPNKAIDYDFNIGISNSFGFGGHNCSLIIGKYNHKK